MVDAPPKTFEALYGDHFDFVFRSLRHLGVSQASVDDAVQEVFVVVHKRLSAFDGQSPRGWLFAILSRIARHHRRSGARRGQLETAVAREAPTSAESTAESIAQREAARLVASMLDSLDTEPREIFVLVELEDMSVVDAAAALEINVNTAHARLRLARDEFAKAAERLRARERFLEARTGSV